jgi:hypothetical protein
MTDGALVARIDRCIAELEAIRAELLTGSVCRDVATNETFRAPAEGNGADETEADDFAPQHLLEVGQAVELFNRPPDSIRWMCRQRDCGRKIAGRWMASAPRLARYLNGGG